MQENLLYFLDAFESIMESIASILEEDPSLKHKMVVQRRFFEVRMKFEDLSEDINLKFNYMDYIAAIDIVVDRGYASIAEISRKLGIIYQQSYKLIERMESEGIVIRGLPKEGEGVRLLNPEYDPD